MGMATATIAYSLARLLPPTQPHSPSVFAQRVAYVVLIAFFIVAWLLAGYSGVYITQSRARVVRHVS
jgi:hypothetical protein